MLFRLGCAASRLWQCIGAMPSPAARRAPRHWTHAAVHWTGLHPSSLFENQMGSARLQQRTRRHLGSQLPVSKQTEESAAAHMPRSTRSHARGGGTPTKYSAASSRDEVPGHLTLKLTSTPFGSPAAAQAKIPDRTKTPRLMPKLGIVCTTDTGIVMQRRGDQA